MAHPDSAERRLEPLVAGRLVLQSVNEGGAMGGDEMLQWAGGDELEHMVRSALHQFAHQPPAVERRGRLQIVGHCLPRPEVLRIGRTSLGMDKVARDGSLATEGRLWYDPYSLALCRHNTHG